MPQTSCSCWRSRYGLQTLSSDSATKLNLVSWRLRDTFTRRSRTSPANIVLPSSPYLSLSTLLATAVCSTLFIHSYSFNKTSTERIMNIERKSIHWKSDIVIASAIESIYLIIYSYFRYKKNKIIIEKWKSLLTIIWSQNEQNNKNSKIIEEEKPSKAIGLNKSKNCLNILKIAYWQSRFLYLTSIRSPTCGLWTSPKMI